MIKIKKGYSVKIVVTVIIVVFLCNNTLYPFPVSDNPPSLLRTPIGRKLTFKRLTKCYFRIAKRLLTPLLVGVLTSQISGVHSPKYRTTEELAQDIVMSIGQERYKFIEAISVFDKNIQNIIIIRNDIRKLTKERAFRNFKAYIIPALKYLDSSKQRFMLEKIDLVWWANSWNVEILNDMCILVNKLDISLVEEIFPDIHSYALRYQKMFDLLDVIPLHNASIKEYLHHMEKLSRVRDNQRTIGVFQGALYFFVRAYNNLLIKPEVAEKLLQDLFRRDGTSGYERWLIEKVVPLLRDELNTWHVALPEGAKSWQDASWQDVVIRSIVGVTFKDRYYVPASFEVNRIKSILDNQNIDRSNLYEFLMGLAYASNMRYFSSDILDLVDKDIVKRHRLYAPLMTPWAGGVTMGGREGIISEDGRIYLAGCLFALPSELGHYYEELIFKRSLKKVAGLKELEIADRFGGLMMLKQAPFLIYNESQDYIYYICKLGEEILKSERMKEGVLDSLRGIISYDRLEKIKNNYLIALEELTPSETYYLGYMYREGNLPFSSCRKINEIKQGLAKSVIKWQDFEKEIANTMGILAFSTQNIGSRLTHALLKPYEEYYNQYHRFSERISVDFSIQIVLSCAKAGISIKVQPYLFSKAFKFVAENIEQRDANDWRAVINTIRQIDQKHIEMWLDELIREGIVRKGTPLSKGRRKGIEEIYREHTHIGEIAALDPSSGSKSNFQLNKIYMMKEAMLFARINELKKKIKDANHYLRKHLKAKYYKEIDKLSNELVRMELNRVRVDMSREGIIEEGPLSQRLEFYPGFREIQTCP